MTSIDMFTRGPSGYPILSAVRVGTDDRPAEYVVLVDCGEGTPIHQYATLRAYVWADRIVFRDGEYNLTRSQALRSLADRAGLIARRDIEIAVICREPYAADSVEAFVDGVPAGDAAKVTVRAEIFYLDPDDPDGDHHELVDGLRRAATLCPAAAAHVDGLLREFARDNRIEVDDA